ncbi:MAG TPA: ATP-binding protein [Terriglobales bacterium]|jgi:signal transduction histidine kinase
MFRVRNYSISKKLTWMNILASSMALGVACTAFIAYDVFSFHEAMARNLKIQARIVGTNSVSALLFNDAHSAEQTLAALHSAPNILQAAIYTTNGKAFASYSRGSGHGAASTPVSNFPAEKHAQWLRNGSIEVVSPILFEGKVQGTVYIQSSLQELIERLKRYLSIVGAVFLVSLITAILMSLRIRRSVADPIVRLAETAQTVSRQKNYSLRVPATSNRDELSSLISTFNDMLEQIEARDDALQEAHNNLEWRVQERTAQLNAANEELEAFSYSVSHDLRAPLRHMSAFSQLLTEEYGSKLEPDARHYLDRIQESARRMGQLVDDLLKMAQISRRALSSVKTDFNSLLNEVVKDLQPECAKRDIRWQIGELPSVECDPGLMKQVFMNLISNAVKYSRRRETAVIEVGLMTKEDESRVIFIRDNGAGFDQRYADKLFGVFQRLHRAEEFEGTGVGLATVQRIIKRHGGKIWALGELDKGSTFFFTLAAISRNSNSTSTTASQANTVNERVMAASAGK